MRNICPPPIPKALPRRLARGCRDILDKAATSLRRHIAQIFAQKAGLHGCQEIETPIIEHATLFASLGESSDINISETYRLQDTDPQIVLRPEGTAGVARAIAEMRSRPLHEDSRVWYCGPMFRRERPQAGRFRQFTQLGAEFIRPAVSPSLVTAHADEVLAESDAITLASDFLTALEIPFELRVNTLGTGEQRRQFNQALLEYLQPVYHKLSAASRKRFLHGNSLRILDSTKPEDRALVTNGPRLSEFISKEERDRFRAIRSLLDEAEVDYRVDETLVRGLDYYSMTAFEFDGGVSGARALCAGGCYEGVYASVCGVGFAVGLERVETAWRAAHDGQSVGRGVAPVAVIALVDGAAGASMGSAVLTRARGMVRAWRARGVPAVVRAEGGRVVKAVTRAIRSGASVVVVVSERDLVAGTVQVKFVRDEGDVAETVGRGSGVEEMKIEFAVDYVEESVKKNGGGGTGVIKD